jgi:hypothetical protein
MDAPSIQWAADFKARKPGPQTGVPGITDMLAGGTQWWSTSDPYDIIKPTIRIGPH